MLAPAPEHQPHGRADPAREEEPGAERGRGQHRDLGTRRRPQRVDRAGELLALDKANTMLGEAGGDSALVVRRGESFMLARFGGAAPRLNRQELGPGAHPIAARDVIEVGNTKFEVVQVRRENQ